MIVRERKLTRQQMATIRAKNRRYSIRSETRLSTQSAVWQRRKRKDSLEDMQDSWKTSRTARTDADGGGKRSEQRTYEKDCESAAGYLHDTFAVWLCKMYQYKLPKRRSKNRRQVSSRDVFYSDTRRENDQYDIISSYISHYG